MKNPQHWLLFRFLSAYLALLYRIQGRFYLKFAKNSTTIQVLGQFILFVGFLYWILLIRLIDLTSLLLKLDSFIQDQSLRKLLA